MNKLIILLLISISIKSFSQSWTPQSAFWIYEAQFMFSKGEVRLSYVKDTLVQNEICQLMKLDMIEYNYLNQKYSYRLYGYEVTYYKSGVTYILNNSKFDTLYFFSANTGDKFNITSKLAGKANDSAYAVVADTGHIEVNSVKLKWLALDNYFTRNNQVIKLRDTIIEKIGSTKYYFLPWDFINGMVDGNQGGRLKCYRDSAFGVYNNSIVGDCKFDISSAVVSSTEYPTMGIFPNPAQDEITLTLANNQIEGRALVYSSTGQIILKLSLSTNSTTIDTRNWNEGLYLIMIQNRHGVIKEKVLIIRNR